MTHFNVSGSLKQPCTASHPISCVSRCNARVRCTFVHAKHSLTPLTPATVPLQSYISRKVCQPNPRHHGKQNQRCVQVRVGDVPPEWTLDQIAGLIFGGFLLVTTALALQVDKVVAKAQRRDLGLCEHCGGVYDPALCNSGRCPSLQR